MMLSNVGRKKIPTCARCGKKIKYWHDMPIEEQEVPDDTPTQYFLCVPCAAHMIGL